MQYSFRGKEGKCCLYHFCCCVLLIDFFKYTSLCNLNHFSKRFTYRCSKQAEKSLKGLIK